MEEKRWKKLSAKGPISSVWDFLEVINIGVSISYLWYERHIVLPPTFSLPLPANLIKKYDHEFVGLNPISVYKSYISVELTFPFSTVCRTLFLRVY